jgi:rare lipoprotein A
MLYRKAFRVCAMAVAGVMVSHTAANASCGTASWYHEGSRTATGERYNPDGISAAHRTLPFGTRVLVTHKRTGRTVVVRINDRGPFIGGRIIDLSRGAKRVLGMDGLAPVCITVLGRGGTYASAEQPAKPRRERVARNQVREVYRTAQTSATYDDDDEDETPVYRTKRAAEKRAAQRRAAERAAAREERRAEAREARAYRQASNDDEDGESNFRVTGWPRS